MNKRAVIILAVIIVVVMLIGVAAPYLSGGSGGNTTGKEAGNNSEAISTEDGDSPTQGAADLLKEDDTSDSGEKTDQESEASDKGSSSAEGSSKGDSGSKDSKSASDKKKKTSGEKSSDVPTISFPYAIEGTDLVVEKISSYSGYYIEDGSDDKVKNIAAIVLTNKGRNLEFVGIGISQGSRSLGFSASQIPAGATVIIQEQNRAEYSSEPYYTATATRKSADNFEMAEKLVSVEDDGKNLLTITNISDKKLSEVKVHYKSYLPDEDVYVGGITYTITLNDLEPGTSKEVSATHYESKHSKVMEVKAKQ